MPEILVAPNSFKECADSVTIARYFKEALESEFTVRYPGQNLVIQSVPISDGGDGFLNVCIEKFDLRILDYKIRTPYSNDLMNVRCGYSYKLRTVFVESADVLGLKIIPSGMRHPLSLSSQGMGDLINLLKQDCATQRLGIDKIVVGIGGTGTSDFGIGMCAALGMKLIDKNGEELFPVPANFHLAERVYWQKPVLPFNIDLILDVDIPLLGPTGASMVFASQKGATFEEVLLLEKGITRIIELTVPGSAENVHNLYGAGGGLSGGFYHFLGAKYRFAEEFMRQDLGIVKDRIKPDIIITGEGSFDSQSLHKKGVYLLLHEFLGTGIPVFICAGKIKDIPDQFKRPDLHFIEISGYFSTDQECIQNIRSGIKKTVTDILKIYFAKEIQ